MKQLLIIALFIAPYFVMGQEVLSPADFYKEVKASEKPQLVDVRTPKEYKEGHIKDFVNIDFHGDDFQTEIFKLDKDRPIFLHCRTKNRSGQTQTALLKMGYTKVINMQGGFEAWKGAGYPIEK